MSTLGSFLRIIIKALVSIPGLMDIRKRDNITPAKTMVIASFSIMTVVSMKVNTKKVTTMDSAFIPGQTADALRATGIRIKNMALVSFSMQTVTESIMTSGRMTNQLNLSMRKKSKRSTSVTTTTSSSSRMKTALTWFLKMQPFYSQETSIRIWKS